MGKTQAFETIGSLRAALSEKSPQDKIGFVPTMGALHIGHLSLVNRAARENDIVVVSIFVNPTQFNNKEDLKKYPRNIEKDLELLSTCEKEVIVFIPSVEEIYPVNYHKVSIELGKMGNVMEGKFRPGHFDGVVEVVYRLFDIVLPDRAYFGLKDFQQLAVIRKMVKDLDLSIEIISCDIVRNEGGLAESSRNERLSAKEKEEALILYHALEKASELFGRKNISEIKEAVRELFKYSELEMEYFELVNTDTLMDSGEDEPITQACIAAFCGEVRLIDNMQLKKHAI